MKKEEEEAVGIETFLGEEAVIPEEAQEQIDCLFGYSEDGKLLELNEEDGICYVG